MGIDFFFFLWFPNVNFLIISGGFRLYIPGSKVCGINLQRGNPKLLVKFGVIS
jgi:hypothetical protein